MKCSSPSVGSPRGEQPAPADSPALVGEQELGGGRGLSEAPSPRGAPVLVLFREMKKKKQQNDSENVEPPEEKQKEPEPQRPPAPNATKGVPAPQPIKRGQKVGRELHCPRAELLPREVWAHLPHREKFWVSPCGPWLPESCRLGVKLGR